MAYSLSSSDGKLYKGCPSENATELTLAKTINEQTFRYGLSCALLFIVNGWAGYVLAP